MDPKIVIKSFAISLRVGITAYILFFFLDIIVYPEYKLTFFLIRAIVSICLALAYVTLPRVDAKYMFAIIASSFIIGAFGISSMCYLTGEGFKSPYYAGNILALIVFSFFLRIELRQFIIVVGGMLVQHFVLLSFLKFEFKDLMLNAFFLCSSAVVAVLANSFINNLVVEVKTLKGMLPICASCKKIRTDTGYWQQMEQYISEHSDAEFTHGICPECEMKLRLEMRGMPTR